MTINFPQILEWLKELCVEEPSNFTSYFLDDVKEYLGLDDADEDYLKDICGRKFDSLIQCQTKEEVKIWLDKICSFIIMKIDTDGILEDYFAC